ncbi:MAG: hypothetical protein KAQ84_01170 [Thermoplasmatales archaeon]|nr:hypothetical protein [Thermoplasmatales archaeon]
MTKEKTSLSDWIQFFSSMINTGNVIIFGCMSIVILLAISFYLFADWAKLIIFFAGMTVLVVVYWFIHGEKSRFRRARIFLDAIMRGKKDDPVKIQKEWCEDRKERGRMFKDIGIFTWKQIRDISITLGVGVLGISLILMIFGTEFFPVIGIQWITSIGLAILALGVAFHSIVISKESDRRVKDIANANFLRVLSIFEDRRIDLQYLELGYLKHRVLIWKALVDMNEAEELLEYCDINLKHQARLIDLMNHMFKFINRYYVNRLVCEELRHILSMTLIGLKVDDEHLGKKNELRGRIRTLLNERSNREITDEYIGGIKGLIDEAFNDIDYLTLRDQIRDWYWS